MEETNKSVSPVLKWAGGKRQIMPAIIELLPKDIEKYNYVEPFIGGGAVLFHLQPHKAVINDFNKELTNVYTVIKTKPDELITDLKRHTNEEEYFYKIRELDRSGKYEKLSEVKRASRMIFLNKTCFNGLYRVNSAGEFNVPFGRYKNPNIINEETIRAVNRYLNDNKIQIKTGDYKAILKSLTNKSFVYLDPPYHPLSPSSSFTGYVKGGWGKEDQIELRKACDDLTKRGIKFLLSNSSAQLIKEQYVAYEIMPVKATRAINADGKKRGQIEELLIRNYTAE